MIRTIYFDFGNVLAFFDHFRAIQRFKPHSPLSEQEIYHLLYDNPLEDAFERGQLSTEEYITQARQAAKIDLDPETFHTYFIDIFTPNHDVLDAIPHLAKTHRILLASNTNAAHFTHYTNRFADTFRHFAATPTSHQCGHRKPEPGYYAYCQTFAECEPHECLFIDDMPGNITAGQAHGWQAVQYRKGDRLLERLQAHLGDA